MAGNSEQNVREWKPPRELFGLLLVFWAVFTLLSLVSYDYLDPGFNQAAGAGHETRNAVGLVGAYWAGLLVDFLGLGAYYVALWPAWRAFLLFFGKSEPPLSRRLGVALFALNLLALLGVPWISRHVFLGQIAGGGFFGKLLYSRLEHYFSGVGAGLVLVFLFVLALKLTLGVSFKTMLDRTAAFLEMALFDLRERFQAWLAARREAKAALAEAAAARAREEGEPEGDGEPVARTPEPPNAMERFLAVFTNRVRAADRSDAETASSSSSDSTSPADEEETFLLESEDEAPLGPAAPLAPPPPAAPPASIRKERKPPQRPKPVIPPDATLPPLELLSPIPDSAKAEMNPETPKRQAQSLVNCLSDFGIQGEVQAIVPGPVVTMFEYKPAPGVKISRIAGLSDDLALSMKALSVRIEAPIPGKDTVGVEIPSETRQTVYLREIFESKEFQKSDSKLTLAIGKDIQGRPQVADLAKMPHLLVAGATGAGKSVCINGLLLSILFKARPDEVKLLLVDPKRIELSVYNDLPHLVHPVVTEMAMAKSALDWAVHDMDKRYEAMARLGVRNIASYNEKIRKMGDNRPEELADLAEMPYLVIVIDELADLMMTAGKEVEISIVRLAQLARAAGIHLVLATQRPSVDVVTGLIKANFPTRISFQVTSKHDSRTILDTVGAEHLLGRGDMLYKPSGGRLTRRHGAFVSDEETAAVAAFWKERAAPSFEIDFSDWSKDGSGADGNGGDFGDGGGDGYDPMYDQALEFVMEQGRASISLIQRRFRIGFNRAARLIEQMERDGLLGPQEGSKPRVVLRRE